MIDRHGYPIRIGWSDHHIVWIEAALSLPQNERTAAFQDIADLVGRPLHSVQNKAYSITRARLWTERRKNVVVPDKSGRMVWRTVPFLPPSEIDPVPLHRLMGRRA